MHNRTFVTSDTHFGHKQIISWVSEAGYRVRPFSCVEHMDEVLIENWNKVVKQCDHVYHLGDVYYGDADEFVAKWSRLNGTKTLVLGNHDDASVFIGRSLVDAVLLFKRLPKLGLIMSHMPLRDEGAYGLHNVHGHLHYLQSPTNRHTCVSVERTDFTPVDLQELMLKIQAKQS